MQILCDILLQMGMADLFTRTIQYAQKETETPLQTGPKMNEKENIAPKICTNQEKPIPLQSQIGLERQAFTSRSGAVGSSPGS